MRILQFNLQFKTKKVIKIDILLHNKLLNKTQKQLWNFMNLQFLLNDANKYKTASSGVLVEHSSIYNFC